MVFSGGGKKAHEIPLPSRTGKGSFIQCVYGVSAVMFVSDGQSIC